MSANNLEWLEKMIDESIAKRQPCKPLIEEIMEGVEDDDDDDGY